MAYCEVDVNIWSLRMVLELRELQYTRLGGRRQGPGRVTSDTQGPGKVTKKKAAHGLGP